MATESSLPPNIWQNWKKEGKSAFLKNLKKCLKGNLVEACRCIHELLQTTVSGTLPTENLSGSLGEIVPLHEEIPSMLLDSLYALDSETSEDMEEQRQSLYQIIKSLEKHLPESLIKERIETDTLLSVGTLKNKNFRTKFIRIKTKLYYKQKKFNLLREESEGYAKLISELNQDKTSSFSSAHVWEAIKSLIGCFNLDPNRVIDLILETLEIRPECSDVFINLLHNFSDVSSVISDILGFKLVHFHRSKEPTPRSLYVLAASLLEKSIVSLNDLYPWLSPSDSVIDKEWELEMRRHKVAVKNLNSLSLSKDKEEPEPELDSPVERYVKNQKFGLCEALLKVGAWPIAKDLILRLPHRCALSQPPISQALCQLIHIVIDPVYGRFGGLPLNAIRSKVSRPTGPLVPAPVETPIDLRKDVIPMLISLGGELHVDPLLMNKVIRICRTVMESLPGDEVKTPPTEDSLYFDILTLLDLVILPSLSYLDCNCGIAEEIWNLLKHFPYHNRYCLYSRWKNEAINDDPRMLHKNAESLKMLKNLMKRISKENIKPTGRLLGKLTHATPCILFDYVLIQLQTFENLIGPVVDSLKFLTSLSFDVLCFSVVDTLAKASNDKSRAKFDGSSISNWLQALASFCGATFKKYNIELTGLLQFVANQLKDKNSLDLLIVREVVSKMTGIEAAEDLTLEQLQALTGGELLKGEAGYFAQVRNTKKSSQRLKEALGEEDLGPALCLLMAQQRHCLVYRDDETTHLKHVARLYDQCQDTLVQFGTFLCTSLTVDEYVSRFPSVHTMLSEYHISQDVAFFLARPTLNYAINQKYEELRKADPNCKKLTLTAKSSKYCEAVTTVLVPLVESVRSLHAPNVWEDISPQFLVTFWSLSMYDLQVPTECYDKEILKLKQQALQSIDSKELNNSKKKKEAERSNALIDKLQEERKKQVEHVEKVMARLKQEKSTWIMAKKNAKCEAIMHFLQLCIFPRCLFTANDAIYCAKFIYTLHMLGTDNFPTVLCLDRLFCDTSYTVTMCTENEANRYGRFLCGMLEIVLRWHRDVNTFNKECLNSSGFEARFRLSNKNGGKQITFEPYRDVCHKWYYKITRAMMLCLESKDFIQIRNALIVLIKILPHYPLMARLAGIINRSVEKVRNEEKTNRPDLYVLATSYFGQLKSKTSNLLRENEFHIVPPKETKEAPKVSKESKEVREKDVVVVDDVEKKPETREKVDRDRSERRETKVKQNDSPGHVREREKEKERSKDIRERERGRERKEEKHSVKEERERDRSSSYHRDDRYYEKEERYLSGSLRDEVRYSGKDDRYPLPGGDGYYGEPVPGRLYYEEARDLSSVSDSPSRSLENIDTERDVKRRKLEGSSKGHRERSPEWIEPGPSSVTDKSDKKERGSRSKEKAPRKDRKTSRKRDRHPEEESPPVESQKLRKDDDIGLRPQNGSSDAIETSHRPKRPYSSRDTRDKTPVYERERERSHERSSAREKQRGDTSKRR